MRYIIFDGNRRLDYVYAYYEICYSSEQVKNYIVSRKTNDLNKYLGKISVYELGKEIKIELNEVPFKGITNEI